MFGANKATFTAKHLAPNSIPLALKQHIQININKYLMQAIISSTQIKQLTNQLKVHLMKEWKQKMNEINS